MNLGGSFSLNFSRSGVEAMFSALIHVAFSRVGGCTRSLVRCHSLQYPVCYSRGYRSGLGFGRLCRMRILQLRLFLGIHI